MLNVSHVVKLVGLAKSLGTVNGTSDPSLTPLYTTLKFITSINLIFKKKGHSHYTVACVNQFIYRYIQACTHSRACRVLHISISSIEVH